MFETVVEWLNKLGVDVVYHHNCDEDNQYCNTSKKITIQNIDNKQRQLFKLLHEAGHAILSWDENFHKEMYPWKHHEDPDIELWLADLLREEYDAWLEGWELSQKLQLDINLDCYEQHADECLNSYRGYALTINDFSQRLFDHSDSRFDMIFNHMVKTISK